MTSKELETCEASYSKRTVLYWVRGWVQRMQGIWPLEVLDARIRHMANLVRSKLGLNIILTFIVNWTK